MGTNTGIGIGIGIPFKNNALGGDKPYFPPELKARMIGVWDNYGKKNTDADRNIIKNKIPNAGGDLEILNAAYKLNSGFGEYKIDFLDWTINSPFINERTSFTFSSFNNTNNDIITVYQRVPAVVQSFKIKAKLRGKVLYRYYVNKGDTISVSYYEVKEGINILPDSVDPTSVNGKVGFVLKELSSIKVEQIPNLEGAFVTDGVNDLIISQKTVKEMVGDNDEITVISMVYYINTDVPARISITNDVRGMTAEDKSSQVFARNGVKIEGVGKLGIYGWSKKGTSTTVYPYFNILGDKTDYESTANYGLADDAKFCPVGEPSLRFMSKQAHYWSFMVIGKLTEDEINLIIGNYNLDRSLKPDILCNIGKQGITNDNHADFNDKLVDYSGNGRDIQMYNLAWKGSSGVAAKKFETIKDYLIVPDEGLQELTIYNEFSYKVKSIKHADRYWTVQSLNKTDVSYPITIIADKDIIWRNTLNYTDENGVKGSIRKKTNVPANVPTQIQVLGFNDFDVPDNYTKVNCVSYATRTDITEFTVTFIPSYKGGILLDGINDFGKVTGMPIYKDYTFIIEREFLNETFPNQVCLVSKSKVASEIENGGAFIVDNISVNSIINPYSFYKTISLPGLNTFDRQIVFQSKYKYLDKDIAAGTSTDSDTLWLGTFRDNDSRFANVAIYFLMSFPYSMSKFLIERQLKKHKLRTLYPVEFRPVIKANANYNIFYTALLPLTGIVWEKINIGDYIPVGRRVAIQLSFDNEASELVSAISSQLGNISITKNSNNKGYTIFGDILKNKSSQKINITIDEYIRYEDIVQPYPVLLRFNDENGNEVSWGGKFRVGSTITRIGSAADSNLLPNIYNIFGLLLNDNQVTSSKVIVEKTMVFKAKSAYIFDNNEPKCILSPRLLRIPNSSYKILGHIPDISGHGNHGVIHNSAYTGMSGANGYPYDYNNSSFWSDSGLAKVVSGELVEYFAVKNSTGFSNITSGVYKGEIKVTGVTKAISENKITRLRIFTNSTTDKEIIDITQDGNYNIDIKGVGDANRVFFYAIPNNPNESIVVRLTEPIYIEQVGEYEGAYCFDGVDDFVTIPTVNGGKQVLMKVNVTSTADRILYDQRNYKGGGNLSDLFAILTSNSDSILAYAGRNPDGKTYIDGILNTNITCGQLLNITHNITALVGDNKPLGKGGVIIGASKIPASYCKAAVYDFMLFDEISTEDKIKELNEYIGIEAKVELPPYYWDAYGKTNFDADRDTIQQRGVAIGDYNLTNYNHAYDKMSGYGGYTFAKFDNTTEWTTRNREDGIEIIKRNSYSFTAKRIGTGQYFYDFQNRSTTVLNKSLTVKAVSNNNTCIRWEYKYRTAEKPDVDSTLLLVRQAMTPNVPITVTLPYKTEQEKADLGVTEGSDSYLFYFDPSDIPVGDEYTVEMLPLYTNGLVYDGMADYSKNANIPALDDFTAIIKREFLKKQGCPLIKGSKVYEGGNGNALLLEWDKAYNFVFYKRTDIMEGELPDNISFITPTNYNGNVITRGSEQDTNGICIAGDGNAGFANMVFYKLILYPKTIPLLQINFLKNLMEKDELIDLNNPIFKK